MLLFPNAYNSEANKDVVVVDIGECVGDVWRWILLPV